MRVEVEEKHRYVSADRFDSAGTTHSTVLQVFLSIFKEGRGSRCELTWVEFEKVSRRASCRAYWASRGSEGYGESRLWNIGGRGFGVQVYADA